VASHGEAGEARRHKGTISVVKLYAVNGEISSLFEAFTRPIIRFSRDNRIASESGDLRGKMGNDSVVPHSIDPIIIPWATSTSLLVKYPESAVRRAVSIKPLRAP
jgi:hypothetical protein